MVGEKDQFKFSKIEKLLGKAVEKGKVPDELGPVPAPGQSYDRPSGKSKNRNNKFKRK
jgi:hypothetical protein